MQKYAKAYLSMSKKQNKTKVCKSLHKYDKNAKECKSIKSIQKFERVWNFF